MTSRSLSPTIQKPIAVQQKTDIYDEPGIVDDIMMPGRVAGRFLGRIHILHLPFPPSVNGAYAGKTRRYKSKRYTRWQRDAGFWLIEQKAVRGIKARVLMQIGLIRPDNKIRDVANYEKCVTDTLVAFGVIEDDSQIVANQQFWILRGSIPPQFGCQITIVEEA